jgi:hypothetical protein
MSSARLVVASIAFMTGWGNSRSEAKYQGERALVQLLMTIARINSCRRCHGLRGRMAISGQAGHQLKEIEL